MIKKEGKKNTMLFPFYLKKKKNVNNTQTATITISSNPIPVKILAQTTTNKLL